MKIKAEYHERIVTVTNPDIPGGVKYRLGDLKSYEVRNFHRRGFISDDMLEPVKPRKTKKNDTREENGSGE